MGSRLVCAEAITDKHMGRRFRIGAIEGVITGAFRRGEVVELHTLVGGSRAWFALEPGAAIEVWRDVK